MQTAYLKTHYPLEYMTALLSHSKNEAEKVAYYIADCQAMDIAGSAAGYQCQRLGFSIEECEGPADGHSLWIGRGQECRAESRGGDL